MLQRYVLSLQVISRPHFLLVTLVLCNAAATEVTFASWADNGTL